VRAVYPNNIWQAAALGLSKTSPGGQQAGCLQCAEHPDGDCFVQNRTRVNFKSPIQNSGEPIFSENRKKAL